jgi:predicted metal-binding membrane protein
MQTVRLQTARLAGVDRIRLILLAELVGLAALAWLLVARRMAGMDAGPGTDPGTLGFYTLSWVVMMAAMMFPSIAPMVLVFSLVQRRRHARGAARRGVSTNLFVAGYLLTWTAAGVAAYAAFVGVRSLSIGALSWAHEGRFLAGAVLLAAAGYQLTPTKNACLSRCRGPLDFVLEHWREGRLGALGMGVVHGAWCVGCCWMLMAALFALGLMSITWMVLIAAAIAAEKLLPSPLTTNRVIATCLAALGLAVMISPNGVPGLVLPDSTQAHHAMQAMPGMHHSTSSAPLTDSHRSRSTGPTRSPLGR